MPGLKLNHVNNLESGVQETSRIAAALMMGYLIRYFHSGNDVSTRDAYLLAGGISACAAIVPVLTHHAYFYRANRMGMRVRVAATALIYKKVGNVSILNPGYYIIIILPYEIWLIKQYFFKSKGTGMSVFIYI